MADDPEPPKAGIPPPRPRVMMSERAPDPGPDPRHAPFDPKEVESAYQQWIDSARDVGMELGEKRAYEFAKATLGARRSREGEKWDAARERYQRGQHARRVRLEREPAWEAWQARNEARKAWERAQRDEATTPYHRRAKRMRAIQKEPIDRGKLLARQHGCCFACKIPLDLSTATLDHLDPVAGGMAEHSEYGCALLCRPCNSSKGARPLTEEWIEAREALAWPAPWTPADADERGEPDSSPPPGLSF